jgi:hypothetical protein
MMRRQTRTLRVVAACLISGSLAGLLTASQCARAESDCHIAALQAFAPDPVLWTAWLHWINWLPGMVFGLLFALAALHWSPYYVRRAALYALASAAIYMTAGLVFSIFLDIAGADEFALIVWIWPAGLSAGLLGGGLLALAARALLFSAPSAAGERPQRLWLPALVGALAGVACVWVCSYGEQQIRLAWPLAFVLWQVVVGLSLLPRSAPAARLPAASG